MGELTTSRGMRILLFVSLALNLLVVGVVAGIAVNGPPGPPGGGRGSSNQDPALPYTRALEEDQRRDLRRQLRRDVMRDRQEMRALRDDIFAGYQEALSVLRSSPYDSDALEAALVRQADHGAELRARGQALLGAYIAEMSAEERAAYADRLEAELSRATRRLKRDDKDRKPPKDRD